MSLINISDFTVNFQITPQISILCIGLVFTIKRYLLGKKHPSKKAGNGGDVIINQVVIAENGDINIKDGDGGHAA